MAWLSRNTPGDNIRLEATSRIPPGCKDPMIWASESLARAKAQPVAFTVASELPKDGHNLRLQWSPGHTYTSRTFDVHVNLAANTEFGQIDSRLDCEQRPRQDPSRVAGFQIIHVSPVAMDFLSQIVARAMTEVLTVPRLLNDTAHSIINFPARDGASGRESCLHTRNSGVTCGGYDSEDLRKVLGYGNGNTAGAGQVTVAGARRLQASPQVHQHKISFANGGFCTR